MKSIIQITVLTITLGFILIFITQGQQAMGQAESPPPVEETEADAKTDAEAEPVETAAVSDDQVEINWFEKLRQGGFTSTTARPARDDDRYDRGLRTGLYLR